MTDHRENKKPGEGRREVMGRSAVILATFAVVGAGLWTCCWVSLAGLMCSEAGSSSGAACEWEYLMKYTWWLVLPWGIVAAILVTVGIAVVMSAKRTKRVGGEEHEA